MNTSTLLDLGQQVLDYVINLDWTFILSFILLAYGIRILNGKGKKVKIATRYLVAIVGTLYGVVLSLIQGYSPQYALVIFQSFVFAFVFHKLLIDKVVDFVNDQLFTKKNVNNISNN
ncbi:MAG: hypothetical protein AAFO82_00075 [Bacteroidota bacterium]